MNTSIVLVMGAIAFYGSIVVLFVQSTGGF